ncbi:TauD/TfdA family dioxygenase [Saccharopolyspora phatthalungensis]|uniref:L-asparagine oxygenase n=1 Tax=Saccharopolyspora phatthalungensis TaxID=664693 RepID=A0A840QK05_9PSEU|nr:TauD/TfdA family dioxygenase [Saccharopolyspora phatthalungensis]MBB5158463.1 L-asparagine oxygenase [Saccharopolyspora phatthalungensis]
MSMAVRTEVPAQTATIEPPVAREVERVALGLLPVAQGRVDEETWVSAAREAWEDLPATLRTTIRRFRRDTGTTGALVVGGLPLGPDGVPDTPTQDGSVQRTATVPAAVLMMFAAGLGDPASFRPEKSGALVQDVVPVPGKEEFQGNAGSVLLSFHTENAFHPHRPDFVMLSCLRSDHEGVAGLRTACIRQVFDLLSDPAREALFSAEFVTEPPPSFGATAGDPTPHAVLSGASDDPDLQIDFSATKPLTTRASAAIDELQKLFADHAHTHYLTPGSMAIVDNRVTVHGRTAFEPRYDGRDRWLQRTFSLADLRASRRHRDADGYMLD